MAQTVILTASIPTDTETVPGAASINRALILSSIPTDTETSPGVLRSAAHVLFPTITITDSALNVTPFKVPTIFKVVGLASEADSALGPVTPGRAIAVGIPAEADTTIGPMSTARSLTVGLAIEADTAIGLPTRLAGVVTQTMSLVGTGHTTVYHADGLITMAMSVVAGATEVPTWVGAPVVPMMSVEAELFVGVRFDGDITLPALSSDGSANAGGALTLPALSIAGTMFNGRNLSGIITLPNLQVAGVLSVPAVYDAPLVMPVLRVAGKSITGAVLNSSATLQPLDVDGTLTIPELLSAALTLPELTATGTLTVSSFLDGGVVLPAMKVVGEMSNAIAVTTESIVVNTKLRLHTKYTNFPFTAFGQLGTSVYGGGSTGLYRLDGADDDGVVIAAQFMSGADDYDSAKLKAQNVIYLGYESSGTVEVLIGVDDSTSFDFTYPVNRDLGTTDLRPARVELGKGLRSRYWRTGVRNVAGSSFKIYELSHGVSRTKRKS